MKLASENELNKVTISGITYLVSPKARKPLTEYVTHGQEATYTVYGCRCDDCTTANKLYAREKRKSRHQRLLADPTIAVHGKISTYTNYGCRCKKCSGAQSAREAERYAERKK